MFKNGLFIISLGFLFFVYSANAVTGSYNWPNIITSVALIVLGTVLAIKGRAKEKKAKEESDSYGN